jgi:hypothetical protein
MTLNSAILVLSSISFSLVACRQNLTLAPDNPTVFTISPNSTTVLSVNQTQPYPNATAFWVFECHTQVEVLTFRHLGNDSVKGPKVCKFYFLVMLFANNKSDILRQLKIPTITKGLSWSMTL